MNLINRFIWNLARKTPQYKEWDEIRIRIVVGLMIDNDAQQKANKIKKRKLRALRDQVRIYQGKMPHNKIT